MTTSFAELSPARRFWALVALAVSLGLVAAAQRDIQRRAADQVRGNRLVWRLFCFNALGALAYFCFGRQPSTSTAAHSWISCEPALEESP